MSVRADSETSSKSLFVLLKENIEFSQMIKMFPSKSIVDYMSEMYKIFPRPNESDLYGEYPSPMSVANRSSSSADSTSPESLSELASSPEERPALPGLGIVDTPKLQDSTLEQQLRQRPIVGRKIIETNETKTDENPTNYEKEHSMWHKDDSMFLQSTSPQFFIEHTPHSVFYELFPVENRGFEFSQFLTPVKRNRNTSSASLNYTSTSISPIMTNTSPNMTNIPPNLKNMSPNMSNMSPNMTNMSPNMTNMSPNMTNMSPNMTNISPNMSNISPNMTNVSPNMNNMSLNMTNMSPDVTNISPRMTNMSPNTNMTNVSPNSYNRSPTPSQFSLNSYDFSYRRPRFESNASSVSSYWNGSTGKGASRSRKPDLGQKICTFCRKNGERPQVFTTHTVKERVGNKNVVSCPILRSHVCPSCGVTGDDAHTITYCPLLRSTNNGAPLESATVTLKSTRLTSSGRRRY